METIRRIISYKDYFNRFFETLRPKLQDRIFQIFDIIKTVEIVPARHLKHIKDTDGLYEIRVKFGNDILRIFCCFDTGNLVVLLSGFIKKTQKTPRKEIDKAVSLMNEYYEYSRKQVQRKDNLDIR
jgi:hypothetical protein bfra3_12798